MRHVSLVSSLSLVAWGLKCRLLTPRRPLSFVSGLSGARTAPRARRAGGIARRAGADPCSVLGLAPGTRDEADVRAAFRKLAKVYHPDVPETGDAVKFQAVQEAARQILEAGGPLAAASLDSIFSWAPAGGAMSRTATSSHAPPSSAARPLDWDAFAGSRGDRVDVKACAARRRADLRKTAKVQELTHRATPETLQRVRGVIARTLNVPEEQLDEGLPLEMAGIALERNCVGYQVVAEVLMALEEEFDVELTRIMVGTWMKVDLPPSVATLGGFADFVESKLHA